ncbi:unnamed protein product [Didymodactylos carnosus]|uniref:LolA-like domain-containing protein n=1 Tax=Didymodactylos carnosus TaxID=1234261 RepID=A0A814H8L9_9BILA|nr:unnamed protein product [Didymodactylos carnosus]CAF3778548.1 unnamed protein product [Didymodactylos carnosus]
MKILSLFVIINIVTVISGQDDWNGDVALCTPDSNPLPPPAGVPFPIFPARAEFGLERVEIDTIAASNIQTTKRSMYEYFYDYDANSLVEVENSNGIINVTFYYYNVLKKSTYYGSQFCNVTVIEMNRPTVGSSAINIDGLPHIRPLDQFLLFASSSPTEGLIRPKYIGEDIVRGIRVDKWETCIVDKTNYVTTKREWSFAKPNYAMPVGITAVSIPVQGVINATKMINSTVYVAEVDEIFNILSYKPGIERADAFSPPRGAFCAGFGDSSLSSLQEQGIVWPKRFSIRIDSTTSQQTRWQTFHLRITQSDRQRIIRYDYTPLANDIESIILDYTNRIKYIIDRQSGSCKIESGINYQPLDATTSPVEFFIKYESLLIHDLTRKFQFNGIRPCETWLVTNIEWAWSMRNQTSSKPFDYPVHLYLKLFRLSPGVGMGFETQDVEYQFYEYSQHVRADDFDISLCYRSNDLFYKHVAFQLKVDRPISILEDPTLDRRHIIETVRKTLVSVMTIQYLRVSDLEIDHSKENDTLYCICTILHRLPSDPASEIGLSDARTKLEVAINTNQFTFQMDDKNGQKLTVSAIPWTLEDLEHFYSFNSNATINDFNIFLNITSNLNDTVTQIKEEIREKVVYSTASQTGGIVGGLMVGIVLGLLTLFLVYRKQGKRGEQSSSFRNVGFRSKQAEAVING